MTSLGKWVILTRARTALGARKSFSILAVTAVAAAGLTAVAGAGTAGAAATHAGRHHHAASVAPGSGPSNDETTISQNDLRDGWDPNEPALTPAALQNGSFGQIFKTPVNGQVYGQPLVVGNTLIVATENDWVYGLNATTGAVLWKTRLATSVQGFPVSFSIDGKQYIAVTTGLGGGSPENMPNVILTEVHRPDNGQALYVFALPDGGP